MQSEQELRRLYLDLIKRSLMNAIYQDAQYQSISMKHGMRPLLAWAARRLRLELVRKSDPTMTSEGRIWPQSAHTMIGERRLDNLQHCVEEVLRDQVPGNLIETGVWRGGACILMRAVLKAYGSTDRTVFVADSFAGIPKPTNAIDESDPAGTLHRDHQLAVSLEQVKANFKAYDLLDDQVTFVKGWFCDTLPTLATGPLAVVRLDGDLYQSTMDGLSNLYPRLSAGGFLIVDDYEIQACRQAVDEYRSRNRIEEPVQSIDWTGIYWRKARHA